MIFKTNTNEAMRIGTATGLYGGGVSIGTATAAGSGNLLVVGSVTGATVTGTTVTGTTVNATDFKTTNFTITESSGKLIFKYGATTIASLDSSGNFITLANQVSGGTP
jgi:hypothetical protein